MFTHHPLASTTACFTAWGLAAVALLMLRWHVTDSVRFGFLLWNIFLAGLPYLAALAMWAMHRLRTSGWAIGVVGLAWLAFLPNAPYIVTDFVHLGRSRAMPLWFDAVMISTFAALGLALGLVSLMVVHRIVDERWGRRWGWTMSLTVLVLCAPGIYLGRVHRFNSWDVLADPSPLVSLVVYRLTHPFGNPVLLVALAAMTIGLVGTYLLTWRFNQLPRLLRTTP